MNLIEWISIEMENDDADKENQSTRLLAHYKKASAKNKKVIDDVFLCLCGWRLSVCIAESDKERERLSDAHELYD